MSRNIHLYKTCCLQCKIFHHNIHLYTVKHAAYTVKCPITFTYIKHAAYTVKCPITFTNIKHAAYTVKCPITFTYIKHAAHTV